MNYKLKNESIFHLLFKNTAIYEFEIPKLNYFSLIKFDTWMGIVHCAHIHRLGIEKVKKHMYASNKLICSM